jgi:hydroxypyruvate reductase
MPRKPAGTSIADEKAAHEMRATARDIFLHALAESSIAKAFDRHVSYSRGVLRVCDDLYDLGAYNRIFVLAMGKAAHTMVEALAAQVGPGLSGIVSAPTEPDAQLSNFRYYRGGHPLPNAESLRAADATLKAMHALPAKALALYLISGGGSAVIEKPIDSDIPLEDVVATYRALVHSGAPIAEINAIRKHLSAIKGGRLAAAAPLAQHLSIMVSDVPDDALDSLASGPTMPDTSTDDDCYAIAQKHNLLPALPGSVRELFERHALDETPKKDDPTFVRSRWWPVLSNATAQTAAAAEAATHGFAVELDNSCDDWDYRKAADHLLKKLRKLRDGVSRVCLISGGEVTVKVEGNAGLGGRNQQFALYCAQHIAGENIAVLSAGTDGVDGNSSATGAVADGTTVARALAADADPAQALAGFNAFPLFEGLGDAIITGPTGNNVRDLRILLAY